MIEIWAFTFSLLAVAVIFCFVVGRDAAVFLIVFCVVVAINGGSVSSESTSVAMITFLLLFSKHLFIKKPNNPATLNNSVPPTASRASIARRNLRRLFGIGRNTTVSSGNLSSKQQKQIEELEAAHRKGFLSDADFQQRVSEINNSHL